MTTNTTRHESAGGGEMSNELFVAWKSGEDFPGEPVRGNPSAVMSSSPMSVAREWVAKNGTAIGKTRIFVKGQYDSAPCTIVANVEMRPVLVSLEFEEERDD